MVSRWLRHDFFQPFSKFGQGFAILFGSYQMNTPVNVSTDQKEQIKRLLNRM
jgi:hypothetical protein